MKPTTERIEGIQFCIETLYILDISYNIKDICRNWVDTLISVSLLLLVSPSYREVPPTWVFRVSNIIDLQCTLNSDVNRGHVNAHKLSACLLEFSSLHNFYVRAKTFTRKQFNFVRYLYVIMFTALLFYFDGS